MSRKKLHGCERDNTFRKSYFINSRSFTKDCQNRPGVNFIPRVLLRVNSFVLSFVFRSFIFLFLTFDYEPGSNHPILVNLDSPMH